MKVDNITSNRDMDSEIELQLKAQNLKSSKIKYYNIKLFELELTTTSCSTNKYKR